jgi:hypothetical protein
VDEGSLKQLEMGGLTRLRFLAASAAWLAASPALAQTFSIQSVTPIVLGTVTAGAVGSTTFDIDPSTGAVTKISGSGTRMTNSTTRAMVTVLCSGGGQPACPNAKANVRVATTGTPTGRAGAMSNLTAAQGSATFSIAPGVGDPITFQLNGWTRNQTRTFYIGGYFPIKGDNEGGATGAATNRLNVRVARAPNSPASPGTDIINNVTVYRGLTVLKDSDLVFGRIVRPATGSTTISVDADDGDPDYGTAVGLDPGLASNAQYQIHGEGGRIISVSMPSTVTLNRTGGGTLDVNLTRFPAGNMTLPGSTGSAGSADLGVGGSFTLSSGTPTGAYSGTVTVTFQYN